MVWSMCKALVTKFGAAWGAVNAASARHKLCGLLLKTAAPELATLVRHGRLRGRLSSGFESAAVQQTGDEKQGDHGNTETQEGQGELRQQRNGALAGVAQIAANGDDAVKVHICEGAVVEAVSGQRRLGLALRTVVRPITVGVGNLFEVLLDGTRKRV